MTFYSGGRRSIQLSYGCPCYCYIQYSLFSIFKVAVDRNPAFFSIFCVFLCIASKKRRQESHPAGVFLPVILFDPRRFRRRINKNQLFSLAKHIGNQLFH